VGFQDDKIALVDWSRSRRLVALQSSPLTPRWREMDSNHRSPVDTLGDTDNFR
jgi:hypothetical protein